MWGTKRQRQATGFAHLVREQVVVQTIDKRSIRGVLTGDYSDADRSPTLVIGHGVELRANAAGQVQEFAIGSDMTIPLANIAGVQISSGGSA